MSPQEIAKHGITAVPIYPAGATLCQVVVEELPPATMARMRASGQIDCGKRQALTPLTMNRVSEAAATALIEAFLANADTDVLKFEDREDAEKALKLVLGADRKYFETVVDRGIPCR